MTTLGELYIKYKLENNLFKNLHETLLKELEDIANNETTIYHNDLYIAYLGPLGISIMEKEGVTRGNREKTGSVTNFKLAEIWNVTIDKENWQSEALPSVFIKNGVDEKVILQLILNEYKLEIQSEICIIALPY
jgi:hypothetical protein